MDEIIKRNTPRDLFLHLLAIFTLYWSAVSFVTLLWQFINYLMPDILARQYSLDYSINLIRFSVSSLFIVFPLFIFVSWYLNKIYTREAVVRESKIRKWLLYLTLFIAALVVVVDLVTVINNLLGGETTFKFILKALSVLVVAGFVFGYYLDDARRDTPAKSGKYFAWATGSLVLIAIVASFFVIGSPATAGLIKVDQQKVLDLHNIQYQIVNYWQRKEILPNSLSDLDDSISSFMVPVDPQKTDKGYVYEYRIINAENLTFELCATFNKEGGDSYNQYYGDANYPQLITEVKGQNDNWQHTAGRVCFERTIDKQLYPPLNKIVK